MLQKQSSGQSNQSDDSGLDVKSALRDHVTASDTSLLASPLMCHHEIDSTSEDVHLDDVFTCEQPASATSDLPPSAIYHIPKHHFNNDLNIFQSTPSSEKKPRFIDNLFEEHIPEDESNRVNYTSVISLKSTDLPLSPCLKSSYHCVGNIPHRINCLNVNGLGDDPSESELSFTRRINPSDEKLEPSHRGNSLCPSGNDNSNNVKSCPSGNDNSNNVKSWWVDQKIDDSVHASPTCNLPDSHCKLKYLVGPTDKNSIDNICEIEQPDVNMNGLFVTNETTDETNIARQGVAAGGYVAWCDVPVFTSLSRKPSQVT